MATSSDQVAIRPFYFRGCLTGNDFDIERLVGQVLYNAMQAVLYIMTARLCRWVLLRVSQALRLL